MAALYQSLKHLLSDSLYKKFVNPSLTQEQTRPIIRALDTAWNPVP